MTDTRRILLSFILVLFVSSNAAAAWDRSADPERQRDGERIARSRHYVLEPAEPLGPAEQAELAAKGIEVTRPLTGGRYLVRVAPGVAVEGPLERLTPEKKIHRGALRSATAGRAFARINVIFHDDVPFEAARAAITAAGGSIEDPLQLDFEEPMRIAARIAPGALIALASDERVLLVQGPRKFRAEPHNRITAELSGVAALHQPPYDLTGAGVAVSFFEFAPADVNHREFEGRLTTHLTGTGATDIEHATHVAGTIIAAGVEKDAKGMAPRATLHQFNARGGGLFTRKADLPTFGVVADNNSWGYVVGWCTAPSCEGWVWTDSAEYYGYYEPTVTAPIDRVTRSAGVLFVHSAGNDAGKRGPQTAPHQHRHEDDNGDLLPGTFCYSQNGSGTDCPVPACSEGPQYCETVRHPEITAELPAPYGSIGLTASAKNNIAVGALTVGFLPPYLPHIVAPYSSQGPARDGRVKPDLVTRGTSVYSTIPNDRYASKGGTSMAAPAVTGMAALLVEQWRRTYGGANPSPAVIKTLLVAGAEDLGNAGPDYVFGFGRANVKNSVDLVIADGGNGHRVKRGAVAHGGVYEVPMTLSAGQNVRAVLGWSDPEMIMLATDPLDASALVNDLDVKVVAPGGETHLPYVLDRRQPTQPAGRGVNVLDNTEVVEFTAAQTGQYKVIVTGTRITAQSPQQFVLVANADMAADPPPCVDPNEPNDTEAQATPLPRGVTVAGRACTAGEVDIFTFVANQPGTVAVTVTATATPLRVTLTRAGASPQSMDVAAGQTAAVTTSYGSTAAAQFFVRVQPSGAIGADTAYTIRAEYPFDPGARRRAVGR